MSTGQVRRTYCHHTIIWRFVREQSFGDTGLNEFFFRFCDVKDTLLTSPNFFVWLYAGPAYTSGIIQEGDILYEVDGHPVLRCATSLTVSYLLGPKDTLVTVAFLRRNEKIVAHLKRQVPVNVHQQQTKAAGSGHDTIHNA